MEHKGMKDCIGNKRNCSAASSLAEGDGICDYWVVGDRMKECI